MLIHQRYSLCTTNYYSFTSCRSRESFVSINYAAAGRENNILSELPLLHSNFAFFWFAHDSSTPSLRREKRNFFIRSFFSLQLSSLTMATTRTKASQRFETLPSLLAAIFPHVVSSFRDAFFSCLFLSMMSIDFVLNKQKDDSHSL